MCSNFEATLIQGWKPVRNLDSNIPLAGFFCFKFKFHIFLRRLFRQHRLDSEVPERPNDLRFLGTPNSLCLPRAFPSLTQSGVRSPLHKIFRALKAD
jgi:hypothetical protein